jgi:hypothetical protein
MNTYTMKILSINPLLIVPILSADIVHAGNINQFQKSSTENCTEIVSNNPKDCVTKENLSGSPDINPRAKKNCNVLENLNHFEVEFLSQGALHEEVPI